MERRNSSNTKSNNFHYSNEDEKKNCLNNELYSFSKFKQSIPKIFFKGKGHFNKSKLSKTQYKILEALAGANECDPDDDADILTLRDMMHAKERFKTDNDVFRGLEVKEFRCDAKAGVVNITANNGEVLRVEFGLNSKPAKSKPSASTIQKTPSAPASKKTSGIAKSNSAKKVSKTPDKYEGIPKNWIPYIQKLSKTTGYSEELIMNIISYESYTPVAKYKKENRGLYEVGFGHTTQANHNNKFGKGFKIDIATAFKWLGQDIKDKESKIKKFGTYYNYNKLSKPMQEAFIDVAFNRGEGRLDPYSKVFDKNYKSVHANIKQGYIGSAAVRLRQEKFYIHEAGLRKRNVQRFLKTLKELPAAQIISSMDLFNREYYYTKTLNMLKPTEADTLRRDWNQIYYSAKKELCQIIFEQGFSAFF